jgi:ribosomal-protein-alanine N-acetyltransferase
MERTKNKPLLNSYQTKIMEIKVETASIRLLDSLYRIEEQCFDEEAFSKRQIAYLLTDYNTIALVAKANTDIAGFIIAQVSENHRHRGVATRLLQEMGDLLKQRGISEIRLEVREDNHAAIKLYHKLGYQTMCKLERYYGKKHGLYLKKVF